MNKMEAETVEQPPKYFPNFECYRFEPFQMAKLYQLYDLYHVDLKKIKNFKEGLIFRHQFYLPTELTAEGVVVDNSVVDGEGDLVDSRSMITFVLFFFRFLSESQNLYLF